MSILNISAVVQKIGTNNQYSYTRIKMLLGGFKGRSTKKEVQHVRQILRREFDEIIDRLEQIEDEIAHK
jgi:hypothetical protein